MAQSNVGKYEKFFDGYGNPVPESKLDVSIQKRIADERDAVFKEVFGDGVSTDVTGWKVTRADLLAVKVAAGSGFVDGQRVVSASDITILGLPVNSTINVYATAAAAPVVYNNEIVGWEAVLGWTTGALGAGKILLAVVVTGSISITSITEGRDIINTQKGAVAVSQGVVAADDAAGIENRMSMIASRIMDISGAFPEDHAADDSAKPKPWYEQLSDDQRGGPRLAARDRSLYGLNRKFEANLSGATPTPASSPTVTPVTSGGSLRDSKYYIVHTWADERGDETAPSPESVAILTGGGGVGRVTVTAPLATAVQSALNKIRVWHRSYDLSQSDNTGVSSWSSVGIDTVALTQGTGADQPTFQTNEINGNKPVLRFDGTSDVLTRAGLSLGTTHTIVVYLKLASTPGQYRILGGATGALLRFVGNELWYQFDSSVGDAKFPWIALPNVWYMVRIVRSGSNISLYVDNVLKSSLVMVGNGSFTFDRLGKGLDASALFNGDIAEVMMSTDPTFDSALAEDYLRSQYYNNGVPITAKSMKVYVGAKTGGPYYKAVVADSPTVDLLSTDNLDQMQPPVSNTTKNVYSHAHSGDVGAMTGAKIHSADVKFTPTGDIAPDNARHAIRNVNSRKLNKDGGTVGPGALTVTLPTSDAHAVPLGVANAAIAALGPSQFRDNELLFEGKAWEPENPGELPRGIGAPGGDQFTLFKATITTHGGLVLLKADTGLTLEGALTHSNQQYAANGTAMPNAGQPLDTTNERWIIPDWKKVVLVVWSFYRNGVLFRENVHAWHSARLDYNAAAYFEFDGFLNVPVYPGSPFKLPRQSYNYIQTLGPVGGLEDSTWGSAFRYCIISPPPKIVDDAVLRVPGTYTYEVRVATLNGATSFRSVRSQGFYGYEGWTVTEQGGGPSLIAEIAPGSGWSYQNLYMSTVTNTLTMPINFTGGIYVAGDNSFFLSTSAPLTNALKLADVITNGSQITSIVQNVVPRGNPGKLKLVELR